MNWVDYIIIGIIAFSALVGVARGLIREVLSLGTWVAALVIAWLFHQEVADLLSTQLSHPLVRKGAAFAGLVLLTLLAGAVLASVLTTLIDTVGLTGPDRLDHVLEGAAGQGVHIGAGIAASLVAVGAGLALKGDQIGFLGHLQGPPRQIGISGVNYTLNHPKESG